MYHSRKTFLCYFQYHLSFPISLGNYIALVLYFLILENISYEYYMIYYRILDNTIRYSTLSIISGCSFILVILGKEMGPGFLFTPDDNLELLILLPLSPKFCYPNLAYVVLLIHESVHIKQDHYQLNYISNTLLQYLKVYSHGFWKLSFKIVLFT